MFLTNISLKRPIFITVIFIALLAIGVQSYMGLPLEQMPNVEMPTITVTIAEPGAAPDQIEAKVTKKVEDACGQLSGIQHISSTITEGVSNTVISFALEKSPAEAAQEVKDKISNIRGMLPTDIREPTISKVDMGATPIISLAVTGSLPDKDLSALVNDKISKQMQVISGVGAVNIYGEEEREIHLNLDKQKMNAYNISLQDLTGSLSKDNIDASSGKISDDKSQIGLKTDATLKNVDDFRSILIAKRGGSQIKLGDVADVEDGAKDKTSLSFYNGAKAIGVDVVKQSDSNTVQVADAVKKSIQTIQNTLPSGVKINVVNDNSTPVRQSVDDVQATILEGCLLAVIIIFIFLIDIASTAISAISLPISIVTTFAMMKVMNFTLNTISLMALSLAVGLLIDDSIVVIENVVRHLRMGKSPIQAAQEGTSEIGLAVLATTLSLVAVFLPIAMVSGLVGKFLVQFGLTITAAVIVSLLVSFTLVPLISSRSLSPEEKHIPVIGGLLTGFNRAFDKFTDFYARMLKVVLNHRAIALTASIGLLICSFLVVPNLGTGFIPTTDMGQVSIAATLDAGYTLDNAANISKNMESIIKKNKNVTNIYTKVKNTEIDFQVSVTEKQNRNESITQIVSELRNSLKSVPATQLSVAAGGGMMSGKSMQFHLQTASDEDFPKLQAYALKAEKAMSDTPGAVDVSLSYKAGNPQVTLEVDRDKAADLGVSPATISSTLSTYLNGSVVSQYETDKDRYDVRMQFQKSDRKNFDSLQGIYVPSSTGKMVSINQVTKKVFTTSASTINRYDKAREIQLSGNFEGMSQGVFTSSFNANLKKDAPLPNGITMGAGGNSEQMTESMSGLMQALLMGIMFMFFVIAAQFESFLDPFAVLLSLPFALIGALFGLLISHQELDMMSAMGVIMLMGLVSKNAILLIDFAKQNYNNGMDLKEALIQSGHTRLRPIIMTSLAMIFGMLPTALANGEGSEQRTPMAVAIIGGLITSTLLTLLVVPVIYTLLHDLKNRFTKKA